MPRLFLILFVAILGLAQLCQAQRLATYKDADGYTVVVTGPNGFDGTGPASVARQVHPLYLARRVAQRKTAGASADAHVGAIADPPLPIRSSTASISTTTSRSRKASGTTTSSSVAETGSDFGTSAIAESGSAATASATVTAGTNNNAVAAEAASASASTATSAAGALTPAGSLALIGALVPMVAYALAA